MRKIKLTQGKISLIDDSDFERVRRFNWQAQFDGYNWYGVRTVNQGDKRCTQMLHRFILNAPARKEVDHINLDGLDNRRENLRLATHSENCRNREKSRNNTSGFKGVYWNTHSKKWLAYAYVGGRRRCVGSSKDKTEAAIAYNKAARQNYGEFARLNEVWHERIALRHLPTVQAEQASVEQRGLESGAHANEAS